VIDLVKRPSVDELVAKRVTFLSRYQNSAYAAQYRAFVDKVRAAESPLASTRLTAAVARYLFKLMSYKDEYEVARLHTDPGFVAGIEAMFEGEFRLVHHLAPPAFAKRNERGKLVKREFGPWIRWGFRFLAALRGLRGTAFDPFGRTTERRTERALIGNYRACIDELLATLSAVNLPMAVEIASLPEGIRGYGHVKSRHLETVRTKWDELMTRWRRDVASLPTGAARALSTAL
jgi:indolepyruvate ferredoxin oxidoreductase